MSSTSTTIAALPVWAERIRAKGLRATQAVIRVLQVLEVEPSPRTHEEIALILQAQHPDAVLDRVTLYRVLDRLAQVGLVQRVQGSDRIWRFALQTSEHAGFFECDHCHQLMPLPEDPEVPLLLARLNQRLREQGIEGLEFALTVHGTCRGCGTQE